jgi:ABC-2 type transport system ATP-binding protein
MQTVLSIENLSKIYPSGLSALRCINLEVSRGEIFALLGPNGAGKTTLINVICGIVTPTQGRIRVVGHDVISEYRAARSKMGLVPQELHVNDFETVLGAVTFSRRLFGKPRNPAHIQKVLKELSLWDKKDSKIMTLSGGMKRRVLIAKALAHEPEVLFLDEPTAGVDVQLRQEMWRNMQALRASGVTIILTTHYIEEAEKLADRLGVLNHGELIIAEEKDVLLHKLGNKQLTLHLQMKLDVIPPELEIYSLTLTDDGQTLVYQYDARGECRNISALLQDLLRVGIRFGDLETSQRSLEEIFVDLVRAKQ